MQSTATALIRWTSRVGSTVVVALGLVAVSAAPAYADPADLRITASRDVDLQVGGDPQRVEFTVSNDSPARAKDVDVVIQVPMADAGVRIVQGPDGCRARGNRLHCHFDRFHPYSSEQLFVLIAPPEHGGPEPGQARRAEGTAWVRYDEEVNHTDNRDSFAVTLRGPDQRPESVRSVSGVVREDASNDPVQNAKVVLTDGDGTPHRTATDGDGEFTIEATNAEPITPGELVVTVSRPGYESKKRTNNAGANETVDIEILLTPKAKPSPSDSPSATPSSSSPTPSDAAAGVEDDDNGSWLIWLLYLLAALLVLGGIATILWLFLRRNEGGDGGVYADRPHGPVPPPVGAHGTYQDPGYGSPYGAGPAAGPYGAGGYGGGPGGPTRPLRVDPPTTALRQGGIDQPTSMLHRPGLDEPTSMIERPGYDQPTSMLEQPGAGEPTSLFGPPPSGEPTSLFGPPPSGEPTSVVGPFDDPTRLHRAAPTDDVYPYGREHYMGGADTHPLGPEAMAPEAGYRPSGYDPPGYDEGRSRPGYGQGPAADPDAGYGTAGVNGPQPGPRPHDRPSPRPRPDRGSGQSERRPDWLDD